MGNRDMIDTNIGKIPVAEYLDIKAQEHGFENYEDLKAQGYDINVPGVPAETNDEPEKGIQCDSESCAFCLDGICRYEDVYGKDPEEVADEIQEGGESDA